MKGQGYTKEVVIFVQLSLPCWVIFPDGSRKGEDDVWEMLDSSAVPDGDLGHFAHLRSLKVQITLTIIDIMQVIRNQDQCNFVFCSGSANMRKDIN